MKAVVGCWVLGVGDRACPRPRPRPRLLTWLFLLLFFESFVTFDIPSCAQQITVGSKKFTESYVLGEIAKKLLVDGGFQVEHRQGMGNTSIVWQALKTGQISLYPEYTGTISEEI